jgi:hypothetical protein
MNFVRKKKRGQNQRVRRTWFSAEKYRIIWRREVHGVQMPARFQATVRTLIPHYRGRDTGLEMWDFVNRGHRLYKTLKAAQDDCERHYRLWTKACEAVGVRALRDLFGGDLPTAIPLWAKKNFSRKTYAILVEVREVLRQPEEEEGECENVPNDPPAVSVTSPDVTTASEVPSGPALSATDSDGSTILPTHRAQSQVTSTAAPSGAPSVKAAVPAAKKPAKKRTAKPLKSTARKNVSTKGSEKSAKRRSGGSRKSKSKPPKN